MIREAFRVVEGEGVVHIAKVEITDQEGVSWQRAKKQLREWYINQARNLRSINKDTYFNK